MLAALGVEVRVWRSDHDPRYEMMSIPLDGRYCVQSVKKRLAALRSRCGESLRLRTRRPRSPGSLTRRISIGAALGEPHPQANLTDPHLLSGIGNAYSDEILHRARLSPFKLTQQLSDEEVARLYHATRTTLLEWIARLRAELGDSFPEKVTAFRPEMAVHGRYRYPCPVCAAPIQRLVYAETECNYCPRCQTDGKLLADRALSRLLKRDWPRTLEELERRRREVAF